ncbi:hypothetical protein BB559_003427 [Furculomyces boomerangus]|uniref:C3H1-type domain-containing protein n=1 Tax=Furculomyces boomerangus TaxID=61424 RepID=A0A2T9YLF8_9FUNG|nr:hypothetical protein BB559_003427 [Furculomyces boomerangus]
MPENKQNKDSDSIKTPNIKSELYKTEQCKNWVLYGTCRYGDACKFAHGFVEQRGRERHLKYKTSLCKDYPLGKCTFGIRCNFAHSTSELIASKNEYKHIPDIKCGRLVSSNKSPFSLSNIKGVKSPSRSPNIFSQNSPPKNIYTLINELYLDRKQQGEKVQEFENLVLPTNKPVYTSQLEYIDTIANGYKSNDLFSRNQSLKHSQLENIQLQPNIVKRSQPVNLNGYINDNIAIDRVIFSDNNYVKVNRLYPDNDLQNSLEFKEKYLESRISPYYSHKASYPHEHHYSRESPEYLASPTKVGNTKKSVPVNGFFAKDTDGRDFFATSGKDIEKEPLDRSLDELARDFQEYLRMSSPTKTKEDFTMGYLSYLGQNRSKPQNAAF